MDQEIRNSPHRPLVRDNQGIPRGRERHNCHYPPWIRKIQAALEGRQRPE
ncbi:MAG: hypothetical protein ABFC57_12455 [Veillonellales bacterium]